MLGPFPKPRNYGILLQALLPGMFGGSSIVLAIGDTEEKNFQLSCPKIIWKIVSLIWVTVAVVHV